MNSTLDLQWLQKTCAPLRKSNQEFQRLYPGEPLARQPVHTVYGGAQLFASDTAHKIRENALKAFENHAPTPADFVSAFGWTGILKDLASKIHERVKAKLRREAVEDFRIDFEDGYGNRPDAEEDGHAIQAAQEVAKGLRQKTLPPFIGIRMKPLNEDLRVRSLRTLDLFMTTLVSETQKTLPENFLITLPKVTVVEQVDTLAIVLDELEKKLGLPAGVLKIEIMIETPQSIFNHRGTSPLFGMAHAGRGRCVAAHFGTYDYTAYSNITAAHQRMDHPVCDFAKHVMQVTFAGTGIFLSDGATNVMPVGDRASVHGAWKLSYSHIRHSLEGGFYQGWDLHPAQVVVRYATLYAFFLEGAEPASARLKNFVEKAAQATLVGDVFDDAATGQGLLNYFLRGIACGAITEKEAEATGLTLDEIRGKSFLKVLQNRKKI